VAENHRTATIDKKVLRTVKQNTNHMMNMRQ
jgi:hypothetical protein